MKNGEHVFGEYKIYCEKNYNVIFFFKAVSGMITASLRTYGDHIERKKWAHNLVMPPRLKCLSDRGET